jgi:hypothetical protein
MCWSNYKILQSDLGENCFAESAPPGLQKMARNFCEEKKKFRETFVSTVPCSTWMHADEKNEIKL